MRVKTEPRQWLPRLRIIKKPSFKSVAEIVQKRSNSLNEFSANFPGEVKVANLPIDKEKFYGSLGTSTTGTDQPLDLSRACDNFATNIVVATADKFKNTYLYQIMTDPNFLDTIQRNKNPKKPCLYCKKEFATEEELNDHMAIQPNESNHVTCCACGKSFAQKRYLRYHQRCHSDRNKFSCEICTKKYSRLDNLTRHNIFHTNPDKFPCHSCERAFARKDLLNKHLKCHENRYKFHCDACQKYFKGPLSLKNHINIFHSNSETNYPYNSL